MNRSKNSSIAPAREYFTSELRIVLEKQRVQTDPDSFEYLVNLLTHFLETDAFFKKNAEGKYENHFLLNLYSEYLQGNLETKKMALRRLGDICLFVTGFFPDSLNRKLVDMDYYFGMGGSAYRHLSHLSAQPLFAELSKKFKVYSEVLGEMSDRTGISSNKDLLRLYEKWLVTKSNRLRDQLATHGIQNPISLDKKIKH